MSGRRIYVGVVSWKSVALIYDLENYIDRSRLQGLYVGNWTCGSSRLLWHELYLASISASKFS